MWVFEKCCICIELRIGCFIIAYLQLISEIILLVLSFLGIGPGQILINSNDPKDRSDGLELILICAVTLLFVIVFMAFTIVLLVGLHKNKPGHIKLFLVYSLVYLAFYIAISLVEVTMTPTLPQNMVTNIIYILLEIYNTLVIRSYWLKMNNEFYENA